MKLVFVSMNEGKIKEAREALGIEIEIQKLKLEEIQSLDLEEIVRKKTEYAFDLIKRPLIVEDVGVFFDAWNGFPGPLIKFMEDVVGYDKVLQMLDGEKNRDVVVRSAIGFHDGNAIHIFQGEVRGIFQKEALGSHGWGFDPYIVPKGYGQTFAQMGPDGKNKISHRALAFKKLRTFLEQ